MPGTGLSSGVITGVIGVGIVVAGCNARVREERQLWNLFDIKAALDTNTPVATSEEFPAGIPATDLLVRSSNGGATLKVQRAFAEGAPAAFVTTEIWIDYYDAVWPQPLYAQFVDAATPVDAPRLIDVGPDSTFYSPFWQVNVAVIGAVPAYHSTKALLDNASQIIPAGMRTCPLRPINVIGALALPVPWDVWNVTLPAVREGEAELDDEGKVETFGLFDFGPDLYELEAEAHGAIVEASPMFVFAKPDGTLLLDEPRVLGAGEVASDPAGPRPRYGGLWHLYKVSLPDGARAFHGSDYPDARDAAGASALDYEGRFALDMTCFADARNFPTGCTWLDSQEQLETVLGAGRLEPTDVTQTGPIVLWNKQAVPPVNP